MTSNDLQAVATTRRPRRRRLVALGAAIAAVVSTAVPLAVPASADSGPVSIVDHHVVVLVNFSDKTLSTAATSHADAVQQLFKAPDSVAAYYAANSGGRVSVVPAQGDGVFGPFTIDVPSSSCDTGKIADLARQNLPAGLSYDHLSIVIPGTGACSWWGLGQVGGSVTWFQEGAVSGGETTAAVHEFGHNLGYDHEMRQLCPLGKFTGCANDGNSHVTPMGGGGDHKGLSAPELIAMKWLPPTEIATPKATATVHLTPLHAATSAAGTRAIDMPLGTAGDRLVIEYRAPIANSVDTDVENPGVFVFRIDGGHYTSATEIRNTTEDKNKMVGSFTGTTPITDLADHIAITYSAMTGDGVDVHLELNYPSTATSTAPTSPSPSHSATHTPSPSHSTHTTSKPSATPHSSPRSSSSGDGTDDLGVTSSPSHTASEPPVSAAAAGKPLAHTGANILFPALAATGVVGLGAVFLLRARRLKNRRH
ncbi:hypothetical protein ABIA35_003491 [Catenulispora sp. MAP12-49]|uniref:hypothetical protein n=1 Tax=Catenulispora sp. MAP12-49 TaxID=3156302 RepID=UPI003518D744